MTWGVVMSDMGCVGDYLKAGVARSGSYHTFFSQIIYVVRCIC